MVSPPPGFGTPIPWPRPVGAVLFDLDGTLCDSEAGIVDHLSRALATVGLPVPDRDVLRTCVGPPWTDGLPAIGVPTERLTDVILAYRATYDDVAASLAVPFPGVVEVLDRLTAADLIVAVATSKPHHLARRIVEEGPLAGRVDLVVGSDPAAGRLTKAHVVGAVLAEVRDGGGPRGEVMVGDRHYDVHGAAAHDVPTVGVGWGCAEPGELAAAGAAHIVDRPGALVDVILDLPGS